VARFYADRMALGSQRARTPEGYLVCLGVPFARTGIQVYRESEVVSGGSPDKIVKVLRSAEEVFAPATLASFEGKPITYPHPPRFLNPDNHASYARGHAQNIRQGDKLPDGEYAILADLIITDSDLIAKVDSNLVTELSAGYDTEYVPDVHAPDIYRQTKIYGNHIAVVPNGRAGNAVKILDSKEEAVETVVDDKVSVSALTGFLKLLGIGNRSAVDSESEAVTRNEEKAAEALRRAKARNEDEAMNEKETAEKKKAADEKEEERRKATDSNVVALTDAVTKLTAALDKKSKDDEEAEKEEKAKAKKSEDEEKEKKEKEEKGEDADLIPVATLSGEEVPTNPIPGADKALDHLREIRAVVAASGDKQAIDSYNQAVRELKGGKKPTGDAYAELLKAKKPELVRNSETLVIGATDAKASQDASEDFVNVASMFHRKTAKQGAELLSAERSK
jgi:hypothetical protein